MIHPYFIEIPPQQVGDTVSRYAPSELHTKKPHQLLLVRFL